MAFSFHAVFEGLALGLMSNKSQTITFWLGLVFHEGIVAFCLGLNLSQSKLTRRITLVSCFLYSIMNPIGMVVGSVLSHSQSETAQSLAVEALLQSVASGTFLYVIFIEIIPREFVHDALEHEHEFFCEVDEEDESSNSTTPTSSATTTSLENADIHKLIKVAILTLGIAFMAIIIYWSH